MGTDHRGQPLNNNNSAVTNEERLKGFSSKDKETYGSLQAAFPNVSHQAILEIMDSMYKRERSEESSRIMDGDYEFEMDRDRRMDREAHSARNSNPDGVHGVSDEDRRGYME